MLFKNATYYKFTKPFELTKEKFEDLISQAMVPEIGANDTYVTGFNFALPNSKQMLLDVNGVWLMRITKLEKIIPAAAVNHKLKEQVEEIEATQLRKVPRKERAEIRESIVNLMLPNAPYRPINTLLYIDTVSQTLVVNSVATGITDDATSFLRKTIGSLPIRMPEWKVAPGALMKSWLQDSALTPPNIDICHQGALKSADKATIKFKQFDDEDVITNLLTQGMEVEELRITTNESFTSILSDSGQLKSIKWDNSKFEDYEDDNDFYNAALHITAAEFQKFFTETLGA